jgi:hypothetical protein
MLVICNLPEIYEKFKARWIERQAVGAGNTGSLIERQLSDTSMKRSNKPKVEGPPKLWNRLNDDNLTPLTLAADLRRGKMLSWLLNERKKVQWSYGDVSCVLHPLQQLDVDVAVGEVR